MTTSPRSATADLVDATAVVFRGGAGRTHGRPIGYGPAKPTRQPTPRPTRALLVAWVAALGVGWAGCIVGATALAGARLEAAIVVGVAAAFVGVGLVATGVPAIPRVRVAAITAIVIGPILTLGGFVVTIAASHWVASHPQLTVLGEPTGPQGSPPDESSEWEAEAEGSRNRIHGPPPLYGEIDIPNLTFGIEEAARYSLMIARVDDADIPEGTAFPATLVQCPWDPENAQVQATTDIWFDTADDPAAIQRVKEYWMTNGYTLVVDDPDLVVVVGVPGSVGAQYSLERTWDDELRLRMQSVCVLQ